jgi:hypothetical protein
MSLLSLSLELAEDFLRRHIKTKAVREAEKRRQERRNREALRRLTRGATVAGLSGAGLFGYGLAVAPLTTAGLAAAGAGAVVATGAALFWPSRRRSDGERFECEFRELVPVAEDWLLAKRPNLPGRAAGVLDEILIGLKDLEPHLCSLDPEGPLAGEARRLIGRHLPRLVEAYLATPSAMRNRDPRMAERLIAGLDTVAEELERLCTEVGRDPQVSFDIQERFIHTRYREPGY